MKTTTYQKYNKPDYTDSADIKSINDNFDKIDSDIKKLSDEKSNANNLENGKSTGSVQMNNCNSNIESNGQLSFAVGYRTIASGNCSHAEGNSTTASGTYSHAEGNSTTASGTYSHAEGSNTTASGTSSHAEGVGTEASEYCSHAEGYETTASGVYSHAEGNSTTASEFSSHAEGYETTASGRSSHAEGSSTEASGGSSHAEGLNTEASGTSSHAEGFSTTASGDESHAEGSSTTASEYCSHAEGTNTTASGNCSHAEGYETTASESSSHAEGYETTASESSSHAEGYETTASGRVSHSQNYWTIADTDYSTAIGSCNKNLSYGDYFVIGNGSSPDSRRNAFRVTSSGTTYSQGAFNTSGADYAEYFEWQDKNLENEDRVGLFVTFDNEDKIRIANSNDDYILGIISATPTVIGNSYNDQWQGMNVRDDFGRVQYHEVEIPEQKRVIHHEAEYEPVIDEDTKETTQKLIREAYDEEILICEARKEIQPILNPDFNPNEEFIGREKRKEWAAVGMLGVLKVYDDGTCKVNGYCKVNDEGKATVSDKGYRVIKRIKENIIEVLFR